MVQGYKQHRYFVRRGTRTVPMSEDEVRAAYEAARVRADKLSELLATLPLLRGSVGTATWTGSF